MRWIHIDSTGYISERGSNCSNRDLIYFFLPLPFFFDFFGGDGAVGGA